MGRSTWGSSTMRTSLISFGFLLSVPAILADSFAGERVKVGKKTRTCSFTFVLNGDRVNVKNSLVSCDKKCSGAAKDVELGGDGMNFYVVSFAVKKGKGKIQKATVELAGATTNRIWIWHASNWRGIWRVRSWVLESLPRDGRRLPDGQHAGLPRSDDDAHGPVA